MFVSASSAPEMFAGETPFVQFAADADTGETTANPIAILNQNIFHQLAPVARGVKVVVSIFKPVARHLSHHFGRQNPWLSANAAKRSALRPWLDKCFDYWLQEIRPDTPVFQQNTICKPP